MEYEYQSIVLSANINKQIAESHKNALNEFFKDGWEYVDSICQAFSSNTGHKGHGAVLVILKRKKK